MQHEFFLFLFLQLMDDVHDPNCLFGNQKPMEGTSTPSTALGMRAIDILLQIVEQRGGKLSTYNNVLDSLKLDLLESDHEE